MLIKTGLEFSDNINNYNMEIKEDRLQAECYTWFHNTYPTLRGLLCYNLNNAVPCSCPKGKRSATIQGNKNKAMGIQKGRSDMVFYYKSRAFMIELKIDNGKQSQAQKDWMLRVLSNGFEYHIIRDLETFKELIKQIIG